VEAGFSRGSVSFTIRNSSCADVASHRRAIDEQRSDAGSGGVDAEPYVCDDGRLPDRGTNSKTCDAANATLTSRCEIDACILVIASVGDASASPIGPGGDRKTRASGAYPARVLAGPLPEIHRIRVARAEPPGERLRGE
jgi:hypothetical protein